jgi:hypothetical protein
MDAESLALSWGKDIKHTRLALVGLAAKFGPYQTRLAGDERGCHAMQGASELYQALF